MSLGHSWLHDVRRCVVSTHFRECVTRSFFSTRMTLPLTKTARQRNLGTIRQRIVFWIAKRTSAYKNKCDVEFLSCFFHQQIWKTQQWPQDWKSSVFIPISKKGNAKECSDYHTIALISHASKVMLKILQAWLQQYVNHELLDVQAGFWKGRGTRYQIANTHWIIEKAREFQKNTYSCFIDYAKAFDCVDHKKLCTILKEMGIPDHLTCLLRNLYSGQEATVRTGYRTTDWFQIRKGVHQGCILSPCLFNLYAEYIIWNAGLDEAQAGIKITGRNINHLRYADDTILMAESEEGLWGHIRIIE